MKLKKSAQVSTPLSESPDRFRDSSHVKKIDVASLGWTNPKCESFKERIAARQYQSPATATSKLGVVSLAASDPNVGSKSCQENASSKPQSFAHVLSIPKEVVSKTALYEPGQVETTKRQSAPSTPTKIPRQIPQQTAALTSGPEPPVKKDMLEHALTLPPMKASMSPRQREECEMVKDYLRRRIGGYRWESTASQGLEPIRDAEPIELKDVALGSELTMYLCEKA